MRYSAEANADRWRGNEDTFHAENQPWRPWPTPPWEILIERRD